MSGVSTVTRVYGGFRGVDFSGDEVHLSRSPDCLNVWKDYKDVDGIRTRPGTQLLESFTEPVYGVFFFRDMMLVHSGTKLYKCTTRLEKRENGSYKAVHGEVTQLYAGLNPRVSDSFIHELPCYYFPPSHYEHAQVSPCKTNFFLMPVSCSWQSIFYSLPCETLSKPHLHLHPVFPCPSQC